MVNEYDMSSFQPPPPWLCKDSVAIMGVGVCQGGRKMLQAMVPKPLVVPEDPQVFVWAIDYPVFILGPYTEALVTIEASYKGVLGAYMAFAYTSSPETVANGREFLGYPKRLAEITVREQGEAFVGRLERCGTHLLTLSVTRKKVGRFHEKDTAILKGPLYMHKIIPSPNGSNPPEVDEIVAYQVGVEKVHWVYEGQANVYFSPEGVDPLWSLNPLKLVRGYVYKFDAGASFKAEVVYRYSHTR